MRILVLGGTAFVGRHMVEKALAAGHKVTLFNRGQRNPDLFPDVEKLRGDRTADLSPLKGRTWDLVIDTSAYLPRVARMSAELLAGAVGHYTFISTVSVYKDVGTGGADESSPVGTLVDPTVEQITGETYGPLKVLCEQAVEAALPGRTLVIRPGLIVGPYDPTDRFTYWPARVARGGEVLAPSRPDYPVQVIDARDLAAWTLKMAETRQTGTYNAVGPGYMLTMGNLLQTCRQVTGADANFTWVPEEFLLKQGVQPWTELPLWATEEAVGMGLIRAGKARAAGLTHRSVAETVRDTLAWDGSRPADVQRRAGLPPEKEQAVLAAWKAALP